MRAADPVTGTVDGGTGRTGEGEVVGIGGSGGGAGTSAGGGTGMDTDDERGGISTETELDGRLAVIARAMTASSAKSAEHTNMTTQRGKRFQPITEGPGRRETDP